MISTRTKSPSRLIRDKALERWNASETRSPVERKFPAALAGTIAHITQSSRPRVYRWLEDPDRNQLAWPELCRIAQELGGHLKCMFSEQA